MISIGPETVDLRPYSNLTSLYVTHTCIINTDGSPDLTAWLITYCTFRYHGHRRTEHRHPLTTSVDGLVPDIFGAGGL